MSSVIQSRVELVDEGLYPSDDGQPMGETGIHVNCIFLLKQALDDHLRSRKDVYVAADMFWYWEEGNPKACTAPDIMVIPGVGREERRSFLSFRENGAIPSVIFEIASESTWRNNVGEKRDLYAKLGVHEYFVFDPESVYLDPALQGFRLRDGSYEELSLDDEDGMISKELGLQLEPEYGILQLINIRTGKRILTRAERVALERDAKNRARADAKRAKGQLKRSKIEIDSAHEGAAKALEETAKAKEETAKALEETAKAKEETAKAKEETAVKEAEIARLKAELEAAKKKSDKSP